MLSKPKTTYPKKLHKQNCIRCGNSFETKSTGTWNCQLCRTKSTGETRPVIERKR